MLPAVHRSTRRSPTRFASLALLGALTLAPACKGDEAGKAGKDGDGKADKTGDAGTPATPGESAKVAPPAGPTSNPVDSPAVAERGEVVATVQVPTGTKMTDLAGAIDAIQPGASVMLGMQIPAALEGAVGFDLGKHAKLDAAMSVIVLDPTSHPQPFAFLVTPKGDGAALSEAAKAAGHEVELQDGLALVGPSGVVAAAKEFAFTNLSKVPDHSEIIVYPQRLLSSYASVLDQALTDMGGLMAGLGGSSDGMTQMFQSYAKAMVALGQQTDRMVISVGSSPAGAELIARLYPLPDTTLAKFIDAQVVSDHALLAKLPTGGESMIMSGNMHAGPARDAFVDFTVDVMAPMWGGMGADEWRALMIPWLDALDGRFAMSMSMNVAQGKLPTMAMTAVMGVNDSATLWTAWRGMLSKMAGSPGIEMMGMKITARHEQKVLEHDGVEIDLYGSDIDTSGLPPDQAAAIEAAGTSNQAMHMAAFDNLAVMATADPDGAAIKSIIDSARGKGDAMTPSPLLTSTLAASKARGDSMLVFFDVASLAAKSGAPAGQAPFKAMAMSAGKHDGAMSFRISLLK